MKYFVLLTGFLLLCLGAERANLTASSDPTVAAIQKQVDDARAAMTAARDEAATKWLKTDEGKTAADEVASAEAKLEQAASEDEKAACRLAMAKARLHFGEQKSKATQTDPAVQQATADLQRLTSELASARRNAESAALEQERKSRELQQQEIQKKIEASIVEVSATQLETMGEKFNGKRVKMTGVTFERADNMWVDNLPGITLQDNGLVSRINATEHDKWIGFFVDDSSGRLFQHCFALKSKFGNSIAAMKRGTKLDLSGMVIELDANRWFGVVCTKITPHVSSDKEEQAQN